MEYTKLLPFVLPMVRNVPKASAVNALRDAAIEFCASTGVWQEDLDPVIILAGSTSGDMDAPTGAVIHRVVSVVGQDGYALTTGAYSTTRQTLTLIDAPKENITVNVRAVLKPSATGTKINDDIAEEFGSDIAHGAIARLKAQSGAEWFDAQGSAVSAEVFKSGVAKAKKDILLGMSGKVSINIKSLF